MTPAACAGLGRPPSGRATGQTSERWPRRGRAWLRSCALLLWAIGALAQPAAAATTNAGRSAAELLRTGNYERAEALFRASIAKGRARALLGLARVQLETGRWAEALATARRAARGPTLFAARTIEGEALLALGDRPAAERVLAQVAPTSPRYARSRVFFGLALHQQGRLAEARDVFERFYDAYDADQIDTTSPHQLVYVAMACRYGGNYQDAADLLRQATELGPRNVEAWVQWGEISLEKHDAKNAERQFRKALAVNARYTPALIGLARIALMESFDIPAALRLLSRARRSAPGNTTVQVLHARALIDETRYAEAIRLLELALKPHPTHLEGLATLAGAYFLADRPKQFARVRSDTLRLNSRYSAFYRTVAELAVRQHRYDDAERLARDALRIDPEDAYAHAALGIDLLRLGREQEGIAELRRAWEGDPYNERTRRLLEFYDKVLPRQYEFARSRHFRLRTHRSETKLLRRVVLPLLERAHAHYARRYRFRPQGPIVVELYREHEHYAVRTVGLPQLAVLGVCFGRVITSVSPTRGQFNWAQVLWHELDHVFTLQLSHARVPRWLTEGLADLEPALVRNEWRRERDLDLYRALQGGRLQRLATLTQAFTRARNPDEIALGYYQGQLLAEFFVRRWGITRVVDALKAYGAGQTTSRIWPRLTGMSLDQIDAAFRATQRQRLAPYARGWMIDPERYRNLPALERAASASHAGAPALSALALGYLLHGERAQAARSAARTLKLERANKGALFTLASLAHARGDPARAVGRYNELIAAGGDGFAPRLALGQLALARSDLGAARKHLDRAKDFSPEASEPHALLASAYHSRNQTEQAIDQLKRLARLSQQEAGPTLRLASLLASQRDYAALREYGLLAYNIQPSVSWLHEALASAFEAAAPRPNLDRAIWHLRTALLCQPKDSASIHRRLAHLLTRQGRKRAAAKQLQLASREIPGPP